MPNDGEERLPGDLAETEAMQVRRARAPAGALVGDQLGPYRLLALLGAGGMGEVYRALDTRLDREVAVKTLPAGVAGDPEALARFEREAKAVAAVSHPNILALHDFGMARGIPYAVMELLEGETLGSRLRRGPIEWREAAGIAAEVVSGLAAAHAKGIAHRDVKPHNIFLTSDRQVKILDFGLARMRPALPESPAAGTRTGVVLGTPGYMSPEQWRGEPAGPPADIFAFGCVLYEMLGGRRPFDRKTAAESIAAVLTGEPAPIGKPVPAVLDELIAGCLRKHAEERIHPAAAVSARLREITSGSRARRRPFGWIAAVVLVAALAFFGRFQFKRAQPAAAESLVVLPLLNETGDSDLEYVADGITETLINSLSQLSRLKVIGRTTAYRYRGKQMDPQKVGRELKVSRVLSGRVVRHADQVTVQADLVNASDGTAIWGDRYTEKLTNMLVLPQRISSQISHALQLKLTGAEQKQLVRRYTEDPEAYRLYLLGRAAWNKRNAEALNKAIAYFEQAIAKDPRYALAYVGLADCYAVLPGWTDMPGREARLKSRSALLKAIEIDETLPEAQATLASLEGDEWNWAESEKRFQKALALNPGNATAHQWYSGLLASLGRLQEASAEIRRAYELDPLSLPINVGLAENAFNLRDYDEAVRLFRKTIEIEPKFGPVHFHLAVVLLVQKKYDEAIAELNQAKSLAPDLLSAEALLGYAYAVTGKRAQALKILQRAGGFSSFDRATLHMGLGNFDQVFLNLNKAFDERAFLLTLLKVDPFFDPLRGDPRFRALLQRMGLN